jgi:2-polyprenyl-6-methoxyphenol hydroxylase-like FAD-dependent oxidoreductase
LKITCVGAGPAGLYFAALTKLRNPEATVSVIERNPRGSTYGFGLVFWDDLRDQLHAADPVSAEEIDRAAFRWHSQVVDMGGSIEDDSDTGTSMGYSIKRQTLLDILDKRAADLGVIVEYGREVGPLEDIEDADLLVACDGVNSRMRDLDPTRFATEIEVGQNPYVWLGTSKVFNSFTFPFVKTAHGWVWAHAYGTDAQLSTFIVECAPRTWTGLGFDSLGAAETLALLESLFAAQLDGAPLFGQALDHDSVQWLNFRRITNDRWHDGKLVLAGDAAHTAHFTIGSGTKLALEDAIALASNLDRYEQIEAGLDTYEATRKQEIRDAESDARHSALWFENLERYIDLTPHQFFVLMQARRSPLLAGKAPLRFYRAFEGLQRETAPLERLRG